MSRLYKSLRILSRKTFCSISINPFKQSFRTFCTEIFSHEGKIIPPNLYNLDIQGKGVTMTTKNYRERFDLEQVAGLITGGSSGWQSSPLL